MVTFLCQNQILTSDFACLQILPVYFFVLAMVGVPKGPKKEHQTAVLSTEGRVVGPCWEKLKPKGLKL